MGANPVLEAAQPCGIADRSHHAIHDALFSHAT